MGQKSAVKRLPEAVRAELDRLILADATTLDELVEILEGQGCQVSRSAVHRYSREQRALADRLRATRAAAGQLAHDLGAMADDKQGQLLVELLQTMLFKAATQSLGADQVEDARDLRHLAQALQAITSAQKASADLSLHLRRALADKVAARISAIETEITDGTAPPDIQAALTRIREEVYGIVEA